MDDEDRPSTSFAQFTNCSSNELLPQSTYSLENIPSMHQEKEQDVGEITNQDADFVLPSQVENVKQIAGLMAVNQVYLEFIEKLITKTDRALEKNRHLQGILRTQLNSRKKIDESPRQFNTYFQCFPPYFRDSYGMASRVNEEAKLIERLCKINPLIKEERPWRDVELQMLTDSVKQDLYDKVTMPLSERKILLADKLRLGGVTVKPEERQMWLEEIDRINRKMLYLRERTVSELCGMTDKEDIDWSKISVTNFKGSRSPLQLKMKWLNELTPKYRRADDEWTKREDEELLALCKKPWIHWDIIADQLGTSRTPYQCFEHYNELKLERRERRPWTLEEDEKLISLIQTLRVGDQIPWKKVASYIYGRSKYQCECRYYRSLNRQLKHGRWTIAEDMILLSAINKYGPHDWVRISENVQHRSPLQCRSRWTFVLDYKRRNRPWLWEEYQRLLFGICTFGRTNHAKISRLLPGRNNNDVRQRIKSLLHYQIMKKQGKKVEFRNVSQLFLHVKDRRDLVLSKFYEFAEGIGMPIKMAKLSQRIGIGSYMLTTDGEPVDYSERKRVYGENFRGRIITSQGRWAQLGKNPNEYGDEELMALVRRLPSDRQEAMLAFLRESNQRLEAELAEEAHLYDGGEYDVDKAIKFYEGIITEERVRYLDEVLPIMLPIEKSDWAHFKKQRNRVPKLLLKTTLSDAPKAKKPTTGQRSRRPRKRGAPPPPLEGFAPKRCANLSAKLYEEVKRTIVEVAPADRRHCLIRNLCMYIRRCDILENQQQSRRGGLHQANISSLSNHLKRVLDLSPRQDGEDVMMDVERKESSAPSSSPVNSGFGDRIPFDCMHNLLAPCVGSLGAVVVYYGMRKDLVRNASRLFDAVGEDYKHRPGLTGDILDIRLSKEILMSPEYIQLRRHIYKIFLLPMMMHHVFIAPEEMRARSVQRRLIECRRQLEQEGNQNDGAPSDERFPIYDYKGAICPENDTLAGVHVLYHA